MEENLNTFALPNDTKDGYYNKVFKKMEHSEKKVTWNWAAFCFGPFWLFYRKMYLHGSIFLFLSIVVTLLSTLINNYVSIFGTIITVIIAIFGNYFYYKTCKKVYDSFDSLNNTTKGSYISNHLGTSIGSAIGAAILYIAIIMIIYFGVGALMTLNEDINNPSNNDNVSNVEDNLSKGKIRLTLDNIKQETQKLPAYVSAVKTMSLDPYDKINNPDILMFRITNNTTSTITDLNVGIMAWDKDNNPVGVDLIDFKEPAYIVEFGIEDLIIEPGKASPIDMSFDMRNNVTDQFSVHLISFTTEDGKSWTNPYFESYVNAVSCKKYDFGFSFEVEQAHDSFKRATNVEIGTYS